MPILTVSAVFRRGSDEPMVELTVAEQPTVRLRWDDARQLGIELLRAAAAAEVGNFLVDWLESRSFDEVAIYTLLRSYEQWQTGSGAWRSPEGERTDG